MPSLLRPFWAAELLSGMCKSMCSEAKCITRPGDRLSCMEQQGGLLREQACDHSLT